MKLKNNNSVLNNKYVLYVGSLIFQILITIFLSKRVFPVYGINDDVIIKSWLSGDYTGNPEFFVRGQATPRIFFSYLVSFLYRVAPGSEWFSLILLGSVIISWSLIFTTINRLTVGKIKIYSRYFIILFRPIIRFKFFNIFFI